MLFLNHIIIFLISILHLGFSLFLFLLLIVGPYLLLIRHFVLPYPDRVQNYFQRSLIRSFVNELDRPSCVLLRIELHQIILIQFQFLGYWHFELIRLLLEVIEQVECLILVPVLGNLHFHLPLHCLWLVPEQ